MLKKVKGILVVVFVCIIMLIQASAIASASGGNGIFTLGRSATSVATTGAKKTTTDSVLVSCTAATYESGSSMTSCKGIVQGSNSLSSGYFAQTGSLTYTFSKGAAYRMINYVKEYGYTYARVYFAGSANANTTFSFGWEYY